MKTKTKKKKNNVSDAIEVRRSSIHATGVFAARDIKKGERLVQYKGKKLSKKYCEKHDVDDTYLFELNDKYNIDGKNEARYLNHSCDPNCETDVVRGKIWIESLKPIKKGEELTYNYGYELEEGIEFICRCGADQCTGFILSEDEWPKIRKITKVIESRIKKKK